MKLDSPFIKLREPHYAEMPRCRDLVQQTWGDDAAERCVEQFIEYFKGGKYAPVFIVAVDDRDDVIGFAAYHRTMLMNGSFELIWIVIDEKWQGKGVGETLTNYRIAEIAGREGQFIQLVTQKPYYFMKFGFFKLHHLGNDWYLMLKLLTHAVTI
jgi:predicted N-acetyltransferase YhbS